MPTNIPEFPSANNRLFPWGDLDGNWWKWMSGFWARLHPVQPNSQLRQIYVGSVEDLRSFDGGDGTTDTPTDFTGAVWEVDADLAAFFPVGVGQFTNAGQVDVGNKTTANAVSGEDAHLLTTSEIPSHTHTISIQTPGYGGEDGERKSYDGGTSSTPITNDKTIYPAANVNDRVQAQSTSAGLAAPTAHNNLPPMIGVYLIKRTGRRFYTSPYYIQSPCQCGPTSDVYTGAGSPEGVVTANEGAVYSDNVAKTIYIKSSGSGNTGWVLA